ncbi:MAG: ChbG/HpnK family deacetylase [Bacteroidales bacterium]|nr:ChbG/HpnK family deacetylase [Bacteroidales bacterium]
MNNIIINADDFGINQTVTSEIERMIELRAISSTTIMANGDSLDEVSRFASLHPEVSFGVHLCLSEYSSLTKSPILQKYGITDQNGDFVRKAIFSVKEVPSELKKALKEELHAQIEKIKSLDIPLSHCDSHHHVHTIPVLRDIFSQVMKEQNIPRLRLSMEFSSLRQKLHLCAWFKQKQYNNFFKKNFKTTDSFYSYSAFLSLRQHPNDTCVELMCHPGHPGKTYKAEMKLVENKILENKLNYKLISYNEI